ncbi:hypothetical protein DOTSEDRAFT_71422 [Dothistroma septosporum NZE10]|uniref:Uncharacterized protein n=1 Tax=Dothistroma septosporum (strain NZE10 / CBS 128990) TaxID=675120 RepID=N1PQJ5_DOTSN|nr:hypothetical protein DOTSEDRAFT_71422 [Dothistroma septosporum NZE10]
MRPNTHWREQKEASARRSSHVRLDWASTRQHRPSRQLLAARMGKRDYKHFGHNVLPRRRPRSHLTRSTIDTHTGLNGEIGNLQHQERDLVGTLGRRTQCNSGRAHPRDTYSRRSESRRRHVPLSFQSLIVEREGPRIYVDVASGDEGEIRIRD